MNYQDLMDILQRRQLNYWAGVPVDANAPSIQDIVTAIQSQYSPTMYAPQIGGANRFVGGGQIGQTGQPSQFGPIEIMPQYGAIAQSLQPGFVPSSFDINVYKNVNPQTLSDVISTIGDGASTGGDVSSGGSSIGQGINSNLAGFGLGLMSYGAIPFAPYGSFASLAGNAITAAQAEAMGEAANALGSYGPGISVVSDANGNVYGISNDASIAAADAAMFGGGGAAAAAAATAAAVAAAAAGHSDAAIGAASQAAANAVVGGANAQDAAAAGANAAMSAETGLSAEGIAAADAAASASAPSGGDSGMSDSVSAAADAAGDASAPSGGDSGGGDGGGGGGGGGKIVCTAMNNAYGFGSFRNAIWIKYSSQHMTKAHEIGYHTIFLPLISLGYQKNIKFVRKTLEHIARHRTADLRAEMRETKRDKLGQIYRFILEPICYLVGKAKGY